MPLSVDIHNYARGFAEGERAAERRIFPLLASIIAAAGGEVTVPMTILHEDYIVTRTEGSSEDPLGATVTYRVTKG